jgi:hypothetical protein
MYILWLFIHALEYMWRKEVRVDSGMDENFPDLDSTQYMSGASPSARALIINDSHSTDEKGSHSIGNLVAENDSRVTGICPRQVQINSKVRLSLHAPASLSGIDLSHCLINRLRHPLHLLVLQSWEEQQGHLPG